MFSSLASLFGWICVAKLLYEIGMFVFICFVREGKDLKKAFGEWAVVTGATDGIGKAVAIELSRKGQKVLLVSRTADRLKEAAAECKGPGTETLVLDFSGDWTAEKAKAVEGALKGKDIGVLFNNVGISYDHPEYFHELTDERVKALIDMNVVSTTMMTRAVLPKMVEKKKGAIVNVSSGAAEAPAPLLAQYGAVKKYVTTLADGLHGEYASKGVHFQSQCPLFVTSKLSKIRNASITTPHPPEFAKASVKAIGYERVISPYWAHYLQVAAFHYLPPIVTDYFANMIHHGLRKRALKKKEQEGSK